MISEVVKNSNNCLSLSNLAGASSDGLPLGTIVAYHGTVAPTGFLLADGSTYDTDKYNALYLLLGSNKLPDLREANLVGVGTNGTNTISVHDVYTLGQFKDDQYQQHGICDVSVTNTSGVKEYLSTNTMDQDGCICTTNSCYLVSAEDQQAFIAKMDKWVQDKGLGNCWTGCLYFYYSGQSAVTVTAASLRAGTACIYCYQKSGINGFNDVLNYDNWTVGLGSTTPSASTSVYVKASLDTPRATVTIGCDECGTPRCGATTHGKQYGVNYIIKAVPGLVSVDEADLYSQIVSYIDNHNWGVISCNCSGSKATFTGSTTNCLLTPTNAGITYCCTGCPSLVAYVESPYYNNVMLTLTSCTNSFGNIRYASMSGGDVGGYMCQAATCVGKVYTCDIVTNATSLRPMVRNYVTQGVGGYNLCAVCQDIRADGLYFKQCRYYCDSSLGCYVTCCKLWRLEPDCGLQCFNYASCCWTNVGSDWCGTTCACPTDNYHFLITNNCCGNACTLCRIAIGSRICCDSTCCCPAIAIGYGLGLKNGSVMIGSGVPECPTYSPVCNNLGTYSVLIGESMGSCVCCCTVAVGYSAGAATSVRCCYCGVCSTSIGAAATALTPGGVALGASTATMGCCKGGVAIGANALSITRCEYTISVINTIYDSDAYTHLDSQHGLMIVNIKPYAKQCDIWCMVCQMIEISNAMESAIKMGMPGYYYSRWTCPLCCQLCNPPTLRFGMHGAFSPFQGSTTYIQTGISYTGLGACPSASGYLGGFGTANANYCGNANALCTLIDCCHCPMSFAGLNAFYGCTATWSTCAWNGMVYF